MSDYSSNRCLLSTKDHELLIIRERKRPRFRFRHLRSVAELQQASKQSDAHFDPGILIKLSSFWYNAAVRVYRSGWWRSTTWPTPPRDLLIEAEQPGRAAL
jgi:hypothetical protein